VTVLKRSPKKKRKTPVRVQKGGKVELPKDLLWRPSFLKKECHLGKIDKPAEPEGGLQRGGHQ